MRYLTTLLILLVCGSSASACQPKVDLSLPQYLIGYGSLMNEKNKEKTKKDDGYNLPVIVKGFRRGWYLNPGDDFPGYIATFLAAVIDTKSQMNAVTFTVNKPEDVYAFDERERGYCRTEVKPEQVQYLSGNHPVKAQFWIYTLPKEKVSAPSIRRPIVESYVDLFLGGCLDLEKKYALPGFAKQCIDTTHGWSDIWVNDRIYPYRAFFYEPQAYSIDTLLANQLPHEFKAIKLL